MLKQLAVSALLGHLSHGKVVNYASLGDDWPEDKTISNNECSGDYQSPINL